MGIFFNPLIIFIISDSLSSLWFSITLFFSAFYHLFLQSLSTFWVSGPFTLGSLSLSVSGFLSHSLGLWHPLIFLSSLTLVSICPSVSLSVGYFFSTSFSGFLYPSFIGFLPILLSLNIWSFLHFCVDFHLSWAFLIHSLGMSSLWASTTPFLGIFLKRKNFHSLSWLLTSVLHILFCMFMFYIVVWITILTLLSIQNLIKAFPFCLIIFLVIGYVIFLWVFVLHNTLNCSPIVIFNFRIVAKLSKSLIIIFVHKHFPALGSSRMAVIFDKYVHWPQFDWMVIPILVTFSLLYSTLPF